MPRVARSLPGGFCYHVITRGNARATVYHDARDYRHFMYLMGRACHRVPLRVLAYCLMPNHLHLVAWPSSDGDLARWMHWLLTTHVRHHHTRYGTCGRVWQGRYKAFPIQRDHHLLAVMRYVERNALRASLVEHAEDWRWSSLAWRIHRARPQFLDAGPVALPDHWIDRVNEPMTEAELSSIRLSVKRSRPFGAAHWATGAAKELGLGSTLRAHGRPRAHQTRQHDMAL